MNSDQPSVTSGLAFDLHAIVYGNLGCYGTSRCDAVCIILSEYWQGDDAKVEFWNY